MKSNAQLALPFSKREINQLKRTIHGGSKSNEKAARPFAPNKWIHLSNRSQRAIGAWSMLSFQNQPLVEKLIRQAAKRYWIVIGDYVNMGNHYHLKVKAKRRQDLQNFLRMINTQLARLIMKAKKGHAKGRFWDGLTFSRLLKSGLEELRLKGYFKANRIEAKSGPKKRQEFLVQFNYWVASLKGRSSRLASLKAYDYS